MFPVLFYLAYCHDNMNGDNHNSILSLFILLYCAIIVRFIFQIDIDTYVINISEDNAINIRVMYQLYCESDAASTLKFLIFFFNIKIFLQFKF